MQKNAKIYVGIDPAFRKNGYTIAIVDEEKTVSFKKFKNGFRDFLGWLMHDCPSENVVFGIENSNLQDKVWQKGISGAVSVGKNQAASQYTVDACMEFHPRSTYEFSPKEKGAKPSRRIMELRCRQVGWIMPKGKVSQDGLDALQCTYLAYNKHRVLTSCFK